MNKPPREDWLPNEPGQLVSLIALLERQKGSAKAVEVKTYDEHLLAAQKKLARLT
jgi:hypothetical protein